MNCELCELQEICEMCHITKPRYHQVVTCEAFKDAVRQYGGKEKILEEIYDLIKNAVLYKEENYDVNQPASYDRLLQSYSFGTVSSRTDENGFLLHTPHVSSWGCGQGDTFRTASIH